MSASDLIALAGKYTVARMLERDDFTKRYKDGIPIAVHEFLYPLAQGYDSVHLHSDVELGGTDQKFNLLVGRDLQKEADQDPQVIITTSILEGTDGKDKMSKSYDNFIAFNDSPNNMYGKVMSIPDSLLFKYFTLVSNVDLKEIEDYRIMLETNKTSYRDLKRKLARDIIAIYYDNDAASFAEQNFIDVFVNKVAPADIKSVAIKTKMKLIDFLTDQEIVNSKSECKRLIKQSAIKINDDIVCDINLMIEPNLNITIKVGKRKFIKIV